jgi:hypothetical protein
VVVDESLHGSDVDGTLERRAAHLISRVSHFVRDCGRHYLVVVDFAVAIM